MAKLRLRVELNKGRNGVPLDKFAHVVVELKKFVEQLGTEIGLPADKNIWFAHEFSNGSGYYTSELAAVAEAGKRERFNGYVQSLTALSEDKTASVSEIPAILIDQFGKITGALDYDEPIGFGIYESDDQSEPTWLHANKLRFISALDSVEFESSYYGSILGTVHALFKGSSPPFLQVRDLVTGELIKCFYKPGDHYGAVAKLLQKEDALVYVHGIVTVSLVKKCIDHVDADHFEVAPEYRVGDINAFIGSVPKLTGDLSTRQYIAIIRGDGKRT